MGRHGFEGFRAARARKSRWITCWSRMVKHSLELHSPSVMWRRSALRSLSLLSALLRSAPYYTVLWQSACVQGDILRGKAAFDFLSKSQLPREAGLAWEEFVVTLKLISAAQKKQLVSLERVLETSGPTSRDWDVNADWF
eukprot:s2948_g7.t1